MIIETTEVNNILQLSGKDTEIGNVRKYAESHAIDFTKNPFHIKGQCVQGYSFTFTASTKKINNALGNFITTEHYPIRFQAGLYIHVQGSVLNDGFYKLASVTATELTVVSTDVLFDEADGGYITINLVKFPDGFKLALAKYIGHLINANALSKSGIHSETLDNFSVTYKDNDNHKLLRQYFSGYMRIGVV